MDDPEKPSKVPRVKKENAVKRETRSRHEKKRREEFNDVLSEMMSLLPDNLEVKYKKVDRQPRQPDKCFIIGNAVHMIKNSDYKPGLLYDSLTRDVFELANTFMIFMDNFVITGIRGEHRTIFDVEKEKMLGKDVRCFLDFQSASRLSFLDPTFLLTQLHMRSFLAKAMTCKIKTSPENPTESVLVCVPDQFNVIAPPEPPRPAQPSYSHLTPPKSPPPSKMEKERPILAALLRKKPTNPSSIMQPLEIFGVPSTSTAVPPSSTFLSPTSSSCSTAVPQPPPPLKTRRVAKPLVPKVRKRIRSQNVIVETFPLPGAEDDEPPPRKTRKRQSAPAAPITQPATAPTVIAPTPIIPIPISVASSSTLMPPPQSVIHQSVIHPVPTQNTTYPINPFEVLSPNYRDIWLRLQSERLLLEERISAKRGELTNLMQISQPQQATTNLLNLPHYFIPPQSSNL